MAELRFQGREEGPFPIWLNPNIWTVVGADPITAPESAPQVNATTWLWCSVSNTGKQPIAAASVRFYIRDPSTVLTPGSAPPLGISTVSLAVGETKPVLCVTPWRPTWINDGHECVVCELSASADPGVFAPDVPWDLNDRHVAQRNFQLLLAGNAKRLMLAHVSVIGLANSPVTRVIIQRSSDLLFRQTLKSVGLERRIDKDISDACRIGLLADFRAHGILPQDTVESTSIDLKLQRNDQSGATAVITGPSETWPQGCAALFHIEQHDSKGQVIGGATVMVANPNEIVHIATDETSTRGFALVREIPVSIPFRPYSIRSDIPFMNVDGFFLTNLGQQYIAIELRNDGSGILSGLQTYIEGASDPNIQITQSVIPTTSIETGATSKCRFLADFSLAAPGLVFVSFIIQNPGAGTFVRIIKKIFVTRVEYDKTSNDFHVPFPQGTMKMHLHSGVLARKADKATGDGCECCSGGKLGSNEMAVDPAFIKSATLAWTPNPAYSGTHGPLPFDDPWNKVGLGILAGILALLGGGFLLIDHLVSSSSGGGNRPETRVEVSVGGTFDGPPNPSIHCCDKVKTSSSMNTVLQAVGSGLLSAAGAVATFAIASDDADFFFRGQQQTIPPDGELTTSELVTFDADYAETTSLGVPFKGKVKWRYARTTNTGRVLQHDTEDSYENPHFLSKYTIQIDGQNSPDNLFVHHRAKKTPLTIRAQFFDPQGKPFVGSRLYVTCLIWTDTGRTRFLELRDNGIHTNFLDFDHDTGNYCTEIITSFDDQAGNWYVFVFAQNVNDVPEGTDPFEAAKTIGGFVLTPQLKMEFDGNGRPCELAHDAVVVVV